MRIGSNGIKDVTGTATGRNGRRKREELTCLFESVEEDASWLYTSTSNYELLQCVY